MITLSQVLLSNATVIALAMLMLWVVSLRLKDASIVDIFWGLGFVLVAWVTRWLIAHQQLEIAAPSIDSLSDESKFGLTRANLLVAMTTIWGLRLAMYLAWRNHGRGEDPRYAEMRMARGKNFWWISFVTVFLLQGTVMWLVSLPVQVGQLNAAPLGVLAWLGVAVWLTGWLFESIGDYQLAIFKRASRPPGSVMDQGLWKYTRHPNYFGNSLIWWGICLLAIDGSTWWLILSPSLMTFLLIKVSGVALLERSLAGRSAEYRDYIERTSSFLPWPPKSAAAVRFKLEKNQRSGG